MRASVPLGWWSCCSLSPRIAVGLFGLAVWTASAEDAASGWLNARDSGASGSLFETTAAIVAGSNQIVVADVGDFKVGQGVMVSKANIRFLPTQLWGAGERYRNMKSVEGSVEVRGYDGSAGSWTVTVLDIAPSPKPAFRWSDDLGRTWHPEQPVTHDWQPLGNGVEVRLNPRDWESGYVVALAARDALISRIEKIEGNVLTLRNSANRTVSDARVRHNDTFALQQAVDLALKQQRKLFVPNGHYRLAGGLRVNAPVAFTIEGDSAAGTVLDISDGDGACLTLAGGTEATIRNLSMVGFMGFAERDKAGELNLRGAAAVWGYALKSCNAVTIRNTQRVMIENCHASRMSAECFVAEGRSRGTARPGQAYSQAITYQRCSVTDSARNAFNDVSCGMENTAVLNCRIVDVGGCAWEGASRFARFSGNYVRNAGTVGIGNLGPANRDDTYPALGAGQTFVSGNVFEGGVCYGGCAVRTARGATQVIIRDNLFVNYGSSAVEVGGGSFANEYPSAHTTVAGNIFDMTAAGRASVPRAAITVGADDTIVSDNQIYVCGTNDAAVTGIRLREPALNVVVHDNLVRNCGQGIVSVASQSYVGEVLDGGASFVARPGSITLGQQPHLFRGWTLAWYRGGKLAGSVQVENFEPLASRFRLKQACDIKAGDLFEVRAPAANWNIHDNIVADCLKAVVLDSEGSETSVLKNNLIACGKAGAKDAIRVRRGRFEQAGNRVEGETTAGQPAGCKE